MLSGTFLPIGRSSLARCSDRRLLRVAVVALICATAPLVVAQTGSQQGATTVSGRVVNARTGAAMARVLVQANGRAVFTSAEGRFQFTDPTGIRSVQLTKPGFSLSPEQRDPETLLLNASEIETTLDVELWPEAILAGTVTSPDGDPLPHITVTAQRSAFQNGVRQTLPSGSTQTDAHGGFRIPVPAGEYVLQTRYAGPDYNRSLAVLPAQLPAHALDNNAGSLHIASGQELHYDLHPQLAAVFHVTVPLEGQNAQRSPSITVVTSTGATYQPPRRVTLEGVVLDLPTGVYQLSARLSASDGDHTGHMILTVPEQDSTGPTLHMDLVPSVPVVVTANTAVQTNTTQGSGTPPDGSALNLQLEPTGMSLNENGGQALRMSGRGSAGNSFIVPSGVYRLAGGEGAGWSIVSATYGGVDLLRQPFVVGPNVSAEPIRVVTEPATGSVSGHTLRAGVPNSCWVVFIAETGTLPRFFVRRSAADGDFNVSGLPFRQFHLLALPLLSTADFADPDVLNHFQSYVQTVSVTASSSAALTLEAVPVHELYP